MVLFSSALGTCVVELVPSVARLDVDGDWDVRANDVLVFARNTGEMRELDVRAASVRVEWHRQEMRHAGGVSLITGRDVATFTLTDVTLSLLPGESAGWMGGVLPGTCAAGAARAGIEAETQGGVGNVFRTGHDDPAQMQFSETWSDPRVTWSNAHTLACEGALYLKVAGPDVAILAMENDTRWATGIRPDPSDPVTEVREWLVLEAPTASLSTASPMALATRAAEVEGVGTARWSAETREGALHFTVAPLEDATLRVEMLEPQASGTLGAAIAPAPATRGLAPVLGGILVGATLVGGFALWRRNGRDVDADTAAALAHAEAEAGRFEAALEWSARARAKAPTTRRLALDEAGYLAALGRIDEALARCADAAASSDKGDPHLAAGRILASSGAPAPVVAVRLVEALARSPELALEVDADEVLADARHERDVRDALARARRELGA